MVLEGVLDRVGAHVGDTVEIEIPEGSRLLGSMLAYGAPVAVLVVGYIVGMLAGEQVGLKPDTAGAVGALTLVAAWFVSLRAWGGGVLAGDRYTPRVRAIISRAEPSSRS